MQISGCLLLPKVLRGTTGPRPNHEVDETWLHPLLSFSPPTCPPVPTRLTHHSGSSRCFPGGSCYFLLPKPSLTISFSCLKNDQWLPQRNQAIKTRPSSFPSKSYCQLLPPMFYCKWIVRLALFIHTPFPCYYSFCLSWPPPLISIYGNLSPVPPPSAFPDHPGLSPTPHAYPHGALATCCFVL